MAKVSVVREVSPLPPIREVIVTLNLEEAENLFEVVGKSIGTALNCSLHRALKEVLDPDNRR